MPRRSLRRARRYVFATRRAVRWFAQILVYIGAVAILVVFAILLTRSSEAATHPVVSRSWIVGLAIAIASFACWRK